jgi:hypothetical protein
MALALLLVSRALALDPWEDGDGWAVRTALRETPGCLTVLGGGLDSAPERLVDVPVPGANRSRWTSVARAPAWVHAEVAGATGRLTPILADGAGAAGRLEGSVRPLLGARIADVHAWVRPSYARALDAGAARDAEGWAGWMPRGRTGDWTLGVGRRSRTFGPARFGGLARSAHPAPNPMGELAWRSPRGGAVRAEVAVGWLDRPRRDVDRPGLLQADVRARPWEWLEVGATRVSLFGGVGRPPVDLGQLLVPTEPHVYGDPERERPDQNELAALDARVALPASWRPRGVRWMEAWWQYGGEDMILEDALGVPLPGLAGVANLGGAEVAAGPLVVTMEGSRLMDDTFRWYVGHRVYHDGFRQDGNVLGVPAGPDSATWTGALGVLARGGDARVRVRASHSERVGVVETRDGAVYALSVPETTWRVGVDADVLLRDWRVRAQAEVARTRGARFVPGASETGARATVSWTRAFVWSGVPAGVR